MTQCDIQFKTREDFHMGVRMQVKEMTYPFILLTPPCTLLLRGWDQSFMGALAQFYVPIKIK